MSDQPQHDSTEVQDAKQEAAENVVERVESWQEGAQPETVKEELAEGMSEAGVEVDDSDLDRAAQQIHDTGEANAPTPE